VTGREYRQDDRDEGYCPVCAKPLTGLTVAGRGYCETHGWQWAEWTPPRYSRAAVEAWAHDHDEYEYLRMEAKLDQAGL
jgi:hypothetical protein